VLHFKKFKRNRNDSQRALNAEATFYNKNESITPGACALGLEATNDTGKRLQRS
jgi:3D (Asp-Asp-Asp) domain-containing protein